MNKRKAKKARKKMICPVLDEFNLLTLNDEEYQQVMKDLDEYRWRHCRYKHYKDRNKKYKIVPMYKIPVGEATRKYMKSLFATAVIKPNVIEVVQDIEKLKVLYEKQEN